MNSMKGYTQKKQMQSNIIILQEIGSEIKEINLQSQKIKT